MGEPKDCEPGEATEQIVTGATLPPRGPARERIICPASLEPTLATLECARGYGFSHQRVKVELRSFIDYWRGRGSVMADWQARFRNHLRETYWRTQYPAHVEADESWREEPTISEMPPANETRARSPEEMTAIQRRIAVRLDATQRAALRERGLLPAEDAPVTMPRPWLELGTNNAWAVPSSVPSAAPAPVTYAGALLDIRAKLDATAYVCESGDERDTIAAELWHLVNDSLRSVGV